MTTCTHRLATLVLCAAALLSTTPAHAFRILFYDVRPAEKLLDLPTLTGSRTVSPEEFEKMDAVDLLEFDMLYVDISASDMTRLAKKQHMLKDAVSAGVGLYLQGDLAAYAASPVEAPATSSLQILAFEIPLAAHAHPLVKDAELMNQDFADQYSATARGFVAVPQGFTVIAEAVTEQGRRWPVMMAGAYNHGRIVLRTHYFTDSDAYGVQKLDDAVIAWLTTNEDEPRKEPIQWLVSNYPRKPLDAAPMKATATAVTPQALADLGPLEKTKAVEVSRRPLRVPPPKPTTISAR
ncbi:MAG: hypothetical protein IT381_12940 [Deltaproteobacteria bacterium]|nr:hypothetical protein [Deltaproteobacteria bacterium]